MQALGFDTARASGRSLEDRRATLGRLGCSGWAVGATAELDRISGRRPAAGGVLTPSEQRVAELLASGRSNKETAARPFLSVHPVVAHVSNTRAKLDVDSRS